MARLLKVLMYVMGVACVAIGVMHFALGLRSVPGEGAAGATVDNRERFYGAIFAGYGLAWLWAVRQAPVPASIVRWLSAVLLLGGVGRLVSLAVSGPPQWFQTVLMVIELTVPLVFLGLAAADRRESAVGRRAGEVGHRAERAQ